MDKIILNGEEHEIHDSGARQQLDNLPDVAKTGSYNDLVDKPSIPEGAVVDATLSDTSTNSVQNKVLKAELDKKVNKADMSTVGSTGSYNDLKDKPSIPPATIVDAELNANSVNPVQNKVLHSALSGKANNADIPGITYADGVLTINTNK